MQNIKFKAAIILTILILISGCKPKTEGEGPAAPIDAEKINEMSTSLCSAGQHFKAIDTELDVNNYNQIYPVIFSFQKGSLRCADLKNVDHGGLMSWLKIDYSNNCLINNSLWTISSVSTMDGNKVYIDFKPVEKDNTNWVKIFTSYGYKLKLLRDEVGLIMYSCQN